MRSAAGSCRELIKGKLYRLRVSYARDGGKRQEDDRRFRGTEREARVELGRMLSAAGKPAPVSRVTVGALLESDYYPSIRSRLKKHSAETAISRVERHAVPRFGHLMPDKLTPRMIDKWTEDMEREKVGASTRAHVYQEFRAALRQLKRWGFLPTDPTEGTHVPPMPRSTQVVLDIPGIRLYLKRFREHGDPELECIVAIMLGTGMRKCEAFGLDWSEVDWDASIAKLVRGRHQYGRDVWEGPLKSDGSYRVVDFPPFTMEVLKRHRGIGRILRSDPDALGRRYRKALDDMKLTLRSTLEALRNAHASGVRELGVETGEIADTLGHADDRVTRERYIVERPATRKRYAATAQRLAGDIVEFPQSPASASDGG